MSMVTNLVLYCALEESGVEKLCNVLQDHHGGKCEHLKMLDTNSAGGNKAMEGEIWAGALNYFDTFSMQFMLNVVTWDFPEMVVLIQQTEDRPAKVYRAR